MAANKGGFSLNSAKSVVGRAVNLHMKDDSVIVNVNIRWIRKTWDRGNVLAYSAKHSQKVVPLKEIAWAEPVQALEVS